MQGSLDPEVNVLHEIKQMTKRDWLRTQYAYAEARIALLTSIFRADSVDDLLTTDQISKEGLETASAKSEKKKCYERN